MLLATIFLFAVLGVEGTATFIAGLAAPLLTDLTKKYFGVNSQKAYLIHVGASVLVTILALAINQQLTIGAFAERFTAVAFISQTLFQLFKRKSGLEVDVEPLPKEEEPTENKPE